MIENIDAVLYRLRTTSTNDLFVSGTLKQAETLLNVIRTALENSDTKLAFIKNE